MTMRCRSLSWMTAYEVIGAPPGPVTRKLSRCGWPAAKVVRVGTRVRPASLSERPPTAAPSLAVVPGETAPWVCGWLSFIAMPAIEPPVAAAVDGAEGGAEAEAVPPLLRRPRP